MARHLVDGQPFVTPFQGLKETTGFRPEEFPFVFESSATEDDLLLLMSSWPPGARLWFWDGAHRTISDPGAYTCLTVREPGEVFEASVSNHGWSSATYSLSAGQAARYVLFSTPFNKGGTVLDDGQGTFSIELAEARAEGLRTIEQGHSDGSQFCSYLLERLGEL